MTINKDFKSNAELMSADELRETALKYYEGRGGVPEDREKAARLFERAAEMGSPLACSHIGFMLLHGDGVAQNLRKAVDFLQRAANENVPQALCQLGILYAEGKGVEPDLKKSAICFMRAEEGGDVLATQNLYKLWQIVSGVPSDTEVFLMIDAYIHHKAQAGESPKWRKKPDYAGEDEDFAVEIEDLKITLN